MRFYLLFFMSVFFLGISTSDAQSKRVMTPEVYKTWNKLSNTKVSHNGMTITYISNCESCDPTLNIYNQIDDTTVMLERAKNVHLNSTGSFVIYERHADKDTLRVCKLSKVKAKDMPGDSLVIFDVTNKSSFVLPNIESFQLPSAYPDILIYKPKSENSKADSLDQASSTNHIIIRNLFSAQEDTIFNVGNYYISDYTKTLIYELVNDGSIIKIVLKNLDSRDSMALIEGHHKIEALHFSKNKNKFAFITNQDTTEQKSPALILNYLDFESKLKQLSINDIPGTDSGWTISDKNLLINDEGTRIFFEKKAPQIEQDSTLLPEDIVNVEVWNYKDQVLYTQQEVRLKSEKEKTFTVMLDIENNKVINLSNPAYSYVKVNKKETLNYALEINSKPYQKYISWKGYSYNDVYLINLITGEKLLIAKKENGNPNLSPAGKYITWFNREEGVYKIYDIDNKTTSTLISNDVIPILNETNDVPQYPSSYGNAGWTENDHSFIVYDRYDIWEIKPNNANKPTRLTNGRGNKQMHRIIQLDKEISFVNRKSKSLLLGIFDHNNMSESYAYLDPNNKLSKIESMGEVLLNDPIKAKLANVLIFTKQSYDEFPDLIVSDSSFVNNKKISNINPQQEDYNWGQIELFTWTNEVGENLKGLLVTPENFDATKKYPLLVNFYEKSSQSVNRHRAPYAHRSTINYTYYTSKGYVIFNPDVTYNKGYPGQSCYEDVISGIEHLQKRGFIDANRIGVQGHSWGGYQVAHLLTKTDIFACAESGAPVVNMVSAYGGIRWRSGMSRMFQYEKTQSRLGATLWERPDLYLENSPIFNMDKVTTPVLILHNDKDGAVPWYQGIEYFVALRRLDKPAWLLNYNDEPHWPVKKQNRFDFNIRMEQFFDHYLMDIKLPQWMDEGIAPIEKGINQKLD